MLSIDMWVQGVGELTDHTTYWNLTYDGCRLLQAFAREGLDEVESAVLFVRRNYARCLTCALGGRPIPAHTSNADSDQYHVVLSRADLAALVVALRAVVRPDLADRLDAIMRQFDGR